MPLLPTSPEVSLTGTSPCIYKTVNDSLWLARICQFGLALPSYVPPRMFRQLRQLTRYRRKLVDERSRARNWSTRPSTTTACGSAVVERNAPRWTRMLTRHGFLAEVPAARG